MDAKISDLRNPIIEGNIPWTADTVFQTNQFVFSANALLKCIGGHTSSSNIISDIQSGNKWFTLTPFPMTKAERLGITSPINGMQILETDVIPYVYTYLNGNWMLQNYTASFLRVYNSIKQTPVVNTAIKFNTVDITLGDSISVNQTTGIFTLQAGGMYEFKAGLGTCYSNSTGGWISSSWQKSTDGSTWTICGDAKMELTNTNAWSHIPISSDAGGYINAEQTTYLRYIPTSVNSVSQIGDNSVITQVGTNQYCWAEIREHSRSSNFDTIEAFQGATVGSPGKLGVVPAPSIGEQNKMLCGNGTWVTVDKTFVGLGNSDNTSDVNKPISTATQTALNNKLNVNDSATLLEWGANTTVRAGETRKCTTSYGSFAAGQLMRSTTMRTTGTLFGSTESTFGEPVSDLSKVNKAFVGLGNVDNTSDANKNVLSATKLTTVRKIYGTSFDGTADITPVFLQLCRGNSDQTLVGLNSDVLFNQSLVSLGNIPFDTTTGIVTLTANRWYELSAEISFSNFSDTTNGRIVVNWVDATTNNVLFGYDHAAGIYEPSSGSSAEYNTHRVLCFCKPTANQGVKLRVTTATGTATFRYNYGSKAVIKQIG